MNDRERLLCKLAGVMKEIHSSQDASRMRLRTDREMEYLLKVKRMKNSMVKVRDLISHLRSSGIPEENLRLIVDSCIEVFAPYKDVREDVDFVFAEEEIMKMSDDAVSARLLGELL